jgi:hypothetical protein
VERQRDAALFVGSTSLDARIRLHSTLGARALDPRPVNVETRRLLIVRFENEHRSVT